MPVYELTAKGHGIQFVRWLLHRILPYPTFLRDRNWVAGRLEITVDSLEEVLTDNSNPLARDLSEMRYTGILSGFLGERWWRGALEDYAWDLVRDGNSSSSHFHDELSKRAGRRLRQTVSHPVICLDSDLQSESEFSTPSDAVRLWPDFWPPFADFAWMRKSTLCRDNSLMIMVDPHYMNQIGRDSDE